MAVYIWQNNENEDNQLSVLLKPGDEAEIESDER